MLSDVLIRRLLIFNVPAAFIGFARALGGCPM
jgi:hypothetical protein